MATEENNPVFQIQRVYLKDMSLEQPNSPSILLEQEQPTVDIQLGVEATPVADGLYEVAVTATVQTKIKDKTYFWLKPNKPVSSKFAIFQKTRWAPSWASPARKLCTPTCAATWQTLSTVLVSHLCIWQRSTSRPCTSNNSSRRRQLVTQLPYCRNKKLKSFRPLALM